MVSSIKVSSLKNSLTNTEKKIPQMSDLTGSDSFIDFVHNSSVHKPS